VTVRPVDARFITTAVAPEGYPAGGQPEIAFVGRSNVGKSSMINALSGRKKLVRVSNTPGRTRTLNFFDVDLMRTTERRTVRFADLPGYGFAKVQKTQRATWEKMITTYLEKRAELRGVVSIIDAEIGPTPDDVRTLGYLRATERPTLVVATKLDRLAKAHRRPQLRAIADALKVDPAWVLGFSATEKLGLTEVLDAVWELTGMPDTSVDLT
jgi:GTP-binding protein